jgi:hypothetical protein
MGVAARAWVLDHYVNEHVLGRTVRYYKRLLERKQPGSSRGEQAATDSVLNPV